MFDVGEKKRNQMVKAAETTMTVIGQGVFIEGQTFKGLGTVRIEGVYLGEMFVDGHVIIGQTGEIRGNITTNTMVVAGTVTGNIVCREELHITESAMIEGDIQTNSLIVDNGAGINGTVSSGRKTLVEPIKLDDAVRNMQNSHRKSLEVIDERASFPPAPRKDLGVVEDKIGFFSK